jgi:Domain of unknown function (DUF5916)/Carbohydrate family 9 binding domain-like
MRNRGITGPRVRLTPLLLTVAALCSSPPAATAQSTPEAAAPLATAAPSRSVTLHVDAPPEPIAPEVITRDAEGRATLRAVRVSQPLRIDGALDEALYRDARSISDFIQVEPDGGQAATERTETWVAFDDDHVYVSFKVWDSNMDTLIATEMRRDSTNSWQGNDLVSFIFDTFYDRRTSFTFTMNPLGGRSDGTMVNDRQYSSDWNPVWETKTARFDGGWAVEAAVPFKSLRYQAGTAQVWGFNAMRVKRSKNEVSTLTRVPPATGQSGFQRAQFAATLVGIEAPRSGANLDVKPYAISNLTTDRVVTPQISNHPEAEAGLDVKYAVTQGLVADLTVNTDFAQVEADEQQINLTRFNLFFPEKRDFFLENQGTFSFGGVAINSAGGNFGGGFIGSNNAAPILFYSRRIGLHENHEVPLNVGGRLTGRAGAFSLGVLNIQTGDKEEELGAPATNFSVIRLKRDVLRRSSIGLLFTNRSESTIGPGANRSYGIDGTFAFFENLQINTYWAGTHTDEVSSRDTDSYRGQLDYSGDRYTVQVERLKIGDNFNPEMGFVRRDDMVRDYARFKFSPRPRQRSAIRKYVYDGSIEYIENGAGRLESRERALEFALEFQSADRFSVNYTNSFEFLPVPTLIGSVVLPVGDYQFDTFRVGYNISQQRLVSANLTAEFGTFYNGHKTSFSAARGRVPVTNQLSVEPTYSFNHVTLEQGEFITHLVGSRVTYSMTPLMFVSALIQYNSGIDAVSTNARFRWEYRPGSELFVVYNEERNTLTPSFPGLNNRAFIVKINRLFRL